MSFVSFQNFQNVMEKKITFREVLVIFGISIFLCLLMLYINAFYAGQSGISNFKRNKKLFIEDMSVLGWERDKIRKTSLYINPSDNTAFSHVKENICSIVRPLVIIMVCSDAKNDHLRKAIRETWASEAENFQMMVLFLVGISENENINRKVTKESATYNDIIIENMIDTYNNLTLKSIYMLKWTTNNCMQARFLMKADDDSYINIGNLYNFVSTMSNSYLKTFLVGELREHSLPDKNHLSKWYMPEYMYPEMEYPAYVLGGGYLMSTYVAEKLYNQSLQNEFIHIEDIYITGICALQSDIRPEDNVLFHNRFYQQHEVECRSSDSRLILLSHYTSAFEMYKYFERLNKC